MKKTTPILTTPAVLWDGNHQLSGRLELWENALFFLPSDFKGSHLLLSIPLQEIEKVEKCLVFNLAQNGLRILSREGKVDLFVIEDVGEFESRLLWELTNRDFKR